MRVVPCHNGHQYGCVCSILCQRTYPIERGSEGNQPVSRYATVCWHHAGYAAAGSRLANRASCISSQSCHRQTDGYNGGGAPAGPSGNPIQGNRVPYWTVCQVLVRAAHSKLVAVGLAEEHGAGALEPLDSRGVIGRDICLKDPGATGRGDVAGADDVLYGDGNAGEGRERLALGDHCVDAVCLGVGTVVRKREVGVQLAVAVLDAGEEVFG